MPINPAALLAAGLTQAEIDVLVERETKRAALVASGVAAREVAAYFEREDQVVKDLKRKQRDDELAAKELSKAIRCPRLDKPPEDHLELLVYLKSVTRYIEAHHPADQLLVSTLLSNMKGKPYEKLDTLSATTQRLHHRCPTWAEIEQSLLDAFGSKTPAEDNRRALYGCYWKAGTLADHVGTFKFIYERVIKDGAMPDVFAIDHFLKSIRKYTDVYDKLRLDTTNNYQAWTELAPLLNRAEIAFGHLEAGKSDDGGKKQKADTHQFNQRAADSRNPSTSDHHHTGNFVPRGRGHRGRFGRGGSDHAGRAEYTPDAGGRHFRGRYAGRSYRGHRGDGGRNPAGQGRGRGNHGGKPHLQLSEEARTWLYENNRCFNCCKAGHSSKDCWGRPSLDELPQDKRAGCKVIQ